MNIARRCHSCSESLLIWYGSIGFRVIFHNALTVSGILHGCNRFPFKWSSNQKAGVMKWYTRAQKERSNTFASFSTTHRACPVLSVCFSWCVLFSILSFPFPWSFSFAQFSVHLTLFVLHTHIWLLSIDIHISSQARSKPATEMKIHFIV